MCLLTKTVKFNKKDKDKYIEHYGLDLIINISSNNDDVKLLLKSFKINFNEENDLSTDT